MKHIRDIHIKNMRLILESSTNSATIENLKHRTVNYLELTKLQIPEHNRIMKWSQNDFIEKRNRHGEHTVIHTALYIYYTLQLITLQIPPDLIFLEKFVLEYFNILL